MSRFLNTEILLIWIYYLNFLPLILNLFNWLLNDTYGNPLQCSCLENPRDRLPSMGSHRVGHNWSDLAWHSIAWGFPGGSMVKNLPANAGDASSIPEAGRSPGRGNDNPLQYFCLENLRDRETWQATFHGVTKSWRQQSTTHMHTNTMFSESHMRLVMLQALINYSVANSLFLERGPQNTCYR